jgi:hypothetical protein
MTEAIDLILMLTLATGAVSVIGGLLAIWLAALIDYCND